MKAVLIVLHCRGFVSNKALDISVRIATKNDYTMLMFSMFEPIICQNGIRTCA